MLVHIDPVRNLKRHIGSICQRESISKRDKEESKTDLRNSKILIVAGGFDELFYG